MNTKTYTITQNGIKVFEIIIEQPSDKTYTNIQWDSKTGLVTAEIDGESRTPIPFKGVSYGYLEPGPFEARNIYYIDYYYWYY